MDPILIPMRRIGSRILSADTDEMVEVVATVALLTQ